MVTQGALIRAAVSNPTNNMVGNTSLWGTLIFLKENVGMGLTISTATVTMKIETVPGDLKKPSPV